MTTEQVQPGTDGQVDENAVAEALQNDMTTGYRPVIPLEALWASGTDMPNVTLRRDIEFMQMHPVVQNTLEVYKSGISGCEFWGGKDHTNPMNQEGKSISQDPRVVEFVTSHVERFWQHGVPLLQESGYPYGWAPGEHIYREINGQLVWSHLKGFHPHDGFILTLNYNPVGVRVKNIREKQPVELWLGNSRIPAKACWYSHRPRFGQLYGRSQLTAAWRPWRRLGWRDAVEQVIDAAIYRAGYRGPVVYYPPGHSAPTSRQGVPATQVDIQGGSRRENRDAARQIGEYSKAGATIALSSEHWPNSNNAKWKIEWPEHVMDVRPLIEAARYLEDQIMLGIGVPPEMVKAGGVGSGYSGRSIPRESFLSHQQLNANAMLSMFIEQVVRPLVLWNFGEIPFEISCKSLTKTQTESTTGEPGQAAQGQPDSLARSQAAKDAWKLRKLNNPTGFAGHAPKPKQAIPGIQQLTQMATHPATAPMSVVLSIVERVLQRGAA